MKPSALECRECAEVYNRAQISYNGSVNFYCQNVKHPPCTVYDLYGADGRAGIKAMRSAALGLWRGFIMP